MSVMNPEELICPHWCRTDHNAPSALVHHGVEVPIPAVVLDFAGTRATTLSMSLHQDYSGCWVVLDDPLISPFAVADLSTMYRIADAWGCIRPDINYGSWID